MYPDQDFSAVDFSFTSDIDDYDYDQLIIDKLQVL